MRPKTRFLIGALGALVLATTPLVPASASTTTTGTVLGTAVTDAGLGNPCTSGSKPCPPTTTTTSKTDGFGLPVTNITTDGNTRSFALSSGVCIDTGTNKGKAAKPPGQFGTCSFAVTGVVTGYCALATGSGSGFYSDALGQNYNLSWKLTWTGPTPELSTITLTGTATKSSNGRSGAFRATFLAQLLFDSCLDKTARVWQVYGEVLIRILN